jgi:hypothetical protein
VGAETWSGKCRSPDSPVVSFGEIDIPCGRRSGSRAIVEEKKEPDGPIRPSIVVLVPTARERST